MNKIRIKEIFESIQGEGPYVGCNQLFIRFCNCNLNCNYCDTEFNSKTNYLEFNPQELANEVKKYKNIHSISLTGGEPLVSAEFLKEFLPLVGYKIYLETNATLTDQLLIVKDYIDIISADIKLESATGIKDTFKLHDLFFKNCDGVETFAKIVFNKKITDAEIINCSELAKKYNLELILQPEMQGNNFKETTAFSTNIFYKFLDKYDKVRLIPQTHKFLDIR